MSNRRHILPVFLLCLALVFFLLLIFRTGIGPFFQNIFQTSLFSVGSFFQTPFHSLGGTTSTKEVQALKKENARLTALLANEQQIEADNKALRDQFASTTLQSARLLPATVVGMPSVIPNVTTPETFILDKGKKDGVQVGKVVVADNDMIIGSVESVSDSFSQVFVSSNPKISFTGRDSATGSLGIVKGQGNGEIIFDNVLLSDSLHLGDVIVTAGSQDISGNGFPPSLVVGKIVGIDKNPSSLFQKARVSLLLSVATLQAVFIVIR